MMCQALVFLLAVVPALGAESARIHAQIEHQGPVWVGERVPITVELLTPTTFASAPVFELPEIPGAVLMRMEEHPTLGTETIDGESYTVQRHELGLFAMHPGTYDIPAFGVRFASAPAPGEPAVEHRLTTTPVRVAARMPPGTETMRGLVSTAELTVEERWEPQPPERARVGDAFTRTITRTAKDVPGMALPPLPLAAVEGLAAYPRPPVVQDHAERGEFTGRRTDAVTYVCERTGHARVPALAVPWWDVASKQLETVTLSAVEFEVGRAPLAAVTRRWLVGLSGAAVLLGGALLWRQRGRVRAMWQRRRAASEAGEAGRFARVERACAAGDPAAAYNALLAWLDVVHRGGGVATIEGDLLGTAADPALRERVRELEDAVTRGATGWTGGALATALRAWRHARSSQAVTHALELPALNPRGSERMTVRDRGASA